VDLCAECCNILEALKVPSVLATYALPRCMEHSVFGEPCRQRRSDFDSMTRRPSRGCSSRRSDVQAVKVHSLLYTSFMSAMLQSMCGGNLGLLIGGRRRRTAARMLSTGSKMSYTVVDPECDAMIRLRQHAPGYRHTPVVAPAE
jgi:hypothetical protein